MPGIKGGFPCNIDPLLRQLWFRGTPFARSIARKRSFARNIVGYVAGYIAGVLPENPYDLENRASGNCKIVA